MKTVRGVVFDWGGVIIDEPSLDLQRFCSARLGLAIDSGSAAIWRYLPMYQEKRITERKFWEMVCDDCGQAKDVIPGASLWADALRSVFRFRDDVVDAIRHLRVCGYKTGFLSNTEPEAAAFFHERQMDNWFDGAVLSCEVGVSKPHPEIYHMMAEQLALPCDTLLFLDDRQENIDGAHAVGMQAVRVSTTAAVRDVLRPLLQASFSRQ